MATDRLALYNIALLAVGEELLDSLIEEREPRRLLDNVYTRGQGAIRYFLEQGFWNHAMRAVEIDKNASVEPAFGFTSAFQIPSDFVKLFMISSGERFSNPLVNYEFETGYIYADVDPLYLKFVSDDTSYGGDFSLWPESFTLWAGTWMGLQIAPKLLNDKDLDALGKREKKLLVDARSKDALQEPTRWPPLSSWNRSRFGRYAGDDRGNRNRLIGS